MSQDEKWFTKYNEVKSFIEMNKRNPSKHRMEEHLMLNWIKHNRKTLNKGELKEPRLSLFKQLLALAEENKHLNQYQ